MWKTKVKKKKSYSNSSFMNLKSLMSPCSVRRVTSTLIMHN